MPSSRTKPVRRDATVTLASLGLSTESEINQRLRQIEERLAPPAPIASTKAGRRRRRQPKKNVIRGKGAKRKFAEQVRKKLKPGEEFLPALRKACVGCVDEEGHPLNPLYLMQNLKHKDKYYEDKSKRS